MFTLRDWQRNPKYKPNLIVNASATDESDSPQPFPIGMCYRYIRYRHLETQIGRHENTVFCGIRDYSDAKRRSESNNRSTIIRILSSNGIQNTLVHSSEYFTSLPKYKFVISPEGAGVDCHRHYEALMAGCIPVVEESEHVRKVYGNCPILYTKDYSEITPEYLLKKYEEMIDKTYDFSRLFISSYSSEEQESIKTNTSYWTHSVRPLDFNWKISTIFRS